MSKYRLEVPKLVQRQIDGLLGLYRQRIRQIILALANHPRPSNAKELRLFPNSWQIRLDNYRIVYSIEDAVLIVEIVKVSRKHGPEFYADIK